jgi:hypothetical protein
VVWVAREEEIREEVGSKDAAVAAAEEAAAAEAVDEEVMEVLVRGEDDPRCLSPRNFRTETHREIRSVRGAERRTM